MGLYKIFIDFQSICFLWTTFQNILLAKFVACQFRTRGLGESAWDDLLTSEIRPVRDTGRSREATEAKLFPFSWGFSPHDSFLFRSSFLILKVLVATGWGDGISDIFFQSEFASFCQAELLRVQCFFIFLSKTPWRLEVKSRKFQLVPLTIGSESKSRKYCPRRSTTCLWHGLDFWMVHGFGP